jgi:glutamyl-tRNA synthetase
MMVRTRFCPSPSSGEKTLHLGNCRTALFAYLVAKKASGQSQFIMRVENTDVARNVPGCAEGMLDDLIWLGIPPTEGFGTNNQPYGPYTQLERLPRYKQLAEDLISRGLAYKCVCSEELLNAQREEATRRNPKAPFKYPGTCRDLKHDPDNNYVIRFKAPLEGETIHEDLVFGTIHYPHHENYDWVIMRADGTPLYNFAVMTDDMDMHITYVIRGRDHMGSNSLIQMLLYKAFGANIPKMAHLPMVNNQQGVKLAKRDGAVSAKSMRALGYIPRAVLSYIAKLGFGHGDKELFSHDELVELFDLTKCGRNDGRFDPKKFAAINYEFLKSTSLTPTPHYTNHLLPFIEQRGLSVCPRRLDSLIPLTRTRSRNLQEAANELDPILRPTITIDPVAAEKILTPTARANLAAYHSFLQNLAVWDEDILRTRTNEYLARHNLTIKDIGQPCRLALTGRTQSPELFQVIAALGKETALQRISNQIA